MEIKREIEAEGFGGDMKWGEVVAVRKSISEAEEEVYGHVPVLDKKHFLSKNPFALQKPLQNFWKKFYQKCFAENICFFGQAFFLLIITETQLKLAGVKNDR